MEHVVRMQPKTLSDGSVVWDVVAVLDWVKGTRVRFACASMADADALCLALRETAVVGITID